MNSWLGIFLNYSENMLLFYIQNFDDVLAKVYECFLNYFYK